MLNKRWLCLCIWLVCVFTFSSFVWAGDYIPGITVSATSGYVTRQPINMVNDSGLTMTMDGLNGSHAVAEDGMMWLGGPPVGDNNPEVFFNLGSVHYVSYMMFWNYNGPGAGGIGVQQADIYYSTDTNVGTATWTLLIGNQVFTAGQGDDTVVFGQKVDFNVMARLIRIDINMGLVDQPYPGSTGWTGISEVKFYDPNLCPNPRHEDLNNDCKIDIGDVAVLVLNWLDCSL